MWVSAIVVVKVDPNNVAGVRKPVEAVGSGRPEELAAATCFLAPDESSFITGIDLQGDGGLAQV